jgi:LuxR family maltose regulon positive regulatory protein
MQNLTSGFSDGVKIMFNIPSARMTVPRAAAGEVARTNLVDTVLNSNAKLVYIHAGAGYGKTTLLSQVANKAGKVVWLSLDGENDIFAFSTLLCEATRTVFPKFDFTLSEYLPFAEKKNFISILAGALVYSIESIGIEFIMVMDDLHTLEGEDVKKLVTCLIKYPPKNVKFCFGSREAPWQELLAFQINGSVVELTQKELSLTREEVKDILGFDDCAVYSYTEGWPLAIASFRVLRENGIPLDAIPSFGRDALYAYLFSECISSLNPEMVDFLKKSACFYLLDTNMLDYILDMKNTRTILDNLVSKNMFTVKTSEGFYRYHALFKSSLMEMADKEETALLLRKAAIYYFNSLQYSSAALLAIEAKDYELLKKIVLACYRDCIKSGNYNDLRVWFKALDESGINLDPEILVARGAFNSVIGNFVQANISLEAAIPAIHNTDSSLYFEAMIHKARVLRNFISFEESNKLLDGLIEKLGHSTDELVYSVVIEKLYNLCLNSQINEAYSLARQMIERFASAGNERVMRWFERYLCTIEFYKGNMKESVYYYEKSLSLDENEITFLNVHSVAIYVAKAYQMIGDRERSIAILSEELLRLRNTGNYEELWAGYLLAADIYYQNTFIDKMNDLDASYETAIRYLTLADEYAPLYRKTDFQLQWAKMQRLTYSIVFSDQPEEEVIKEIFKNLECSGAYLKCIVLSRLMGYFTAESDFKNAVKCAQMCIETGEKTGYLLHASMAYGVLARVAIELKDNEKAVLLTRRYLRLCAENGLYEYFRLRKAYYPVLEFALSNGIEPEFARLMMEFAGYRHSKIYIETLGPFTVYKDKSKQSIVKFRTKKERELLAFLLNAGDQGATKEQIHNAIWWESESENIKNLISVNLRHIKHDLKNAGIEDAVISRDNRYFIRRDEIELDTDVFDELYRDFRLSPDKEKAKSIIGLYKGEYLSDFEALWATAAKLKYHEIFEEAKRFCEMGAISATTGDNGLLF